MVATAAREARTPLLPSGSGPFFARRLSELAGLALIALAAVIGDRAGQLFGGRPLLQQRRQQRVGQSDRPPRRLRRGPSAAVVRPRRRTGAGGPRGLGLGPAQPPRVEPAAGALRPGASLHPARCHRLRVGGHCRLADCGWRRRGRRQDGARRAWPRSGSTASIWEAVPEWPQAGVGAIVPDRCRRCTDLRARRAVARMARAVPGLFTGCCSVSSVSLFGSPARDTTEAAIAQPTLRSTTRKSPPARRPRRLARSAEKTTRRREPSLLPLNTRRGRGTAGRAQHRREASTQGEARQAGEEGASARTRP